MKENKAKKSSKKISRKKSKKGIGDLVIFWTVVVLVAIGFIMIFSSSSYSAYFEYDGDDFEPADLCENIDNDEDEGV